MLPAIPSRAKPGGRARMYMDARNTGTLRPPHRHHPTMFQAPIIQSLSRGTGVLPGNTLVIRAELPILPRFVPKSSLRRIPYLRPQWILDHRGDAQVIVVTAPSFQRHLPRDPALHVFKCNDYCQKQVVKISYTEDGLYFLARFDCFSATTPVDRSCWHRAFSWFPSLKNAGTRFILSESIVKSIWDLFTPNLASSP